MDHGLPQGSETILLVDDQEEVRTTTACILEELGYSVIEAESAEEALHLATTYSFQLLLVDVVMPEMSGFSLAHKISSVQPAARVLYFSAYTSDQILKEQFEERPGVSFIRKPFTVGAMARAVRELLDHPDTTPSTPDPAPGGTESVLVMADDPRAGRFMVKSLERLGYHILEARDADRALSIALKSKVDLVVLDVRRSQVSGPDLARSIAGKRPHLRFLLISEVEPSEATPERETGQRPPEFLLKPFSPDELGEAVRKGLDAP